MRYKRKHTGKEKLPVIPSVPASPRNGKMSLTGKTAFFILNFGRAYIPFFLPTREGPAEGEPGRP
jgi:hypothetical protein